MYGIYLPDNVPIKIQAKVGKYNVRPNGSRHGFI